MTTVELSGSALPLSSTDVVGKWQSVFPQNSRFDCLFLQVFSEFSGGVEKVAQVAIQQIFQFIKEC